MYKHLRRRLKEGPVLPPTSCVFLSLTVCSITLTRLINQGCCVLKLQFALTSAHSYIVCRTQCASQAVKQQIMVHVTPLLVFAFSPISLL